MIVKVQLSLSTTHRSQMCLVYNEDHSIEYESEASPEIQTLMAGRLKAYFNAEIVGTLLDIREEVEEQDW